jgi:alkanesulfonate monooxygenase SsuD/methylene tetrahydromethanopterin reductase-like flavin-dependent oxidoreductase (luciferase family)
MKERFEMLEEMLQIAKKMWAGDTSPYEGKHYQLPYPVNCPQPLSKPHPPILVGGMGAKKTMRLVATYGDACNFFGTAEPALLTERLDDLKRLCEASGRPYEGIEKTVLVTVDLDEEGVKGIIEKGQALQRLGFEHLIYNLKLAYTPDALKMFTKEIIPGLKG